MSMEDLDQPAHLYSLVSFVQICIKCMGSKNHYPKGKTILARSCVCTGFVNMLFLMMLYYVIT